MLTALHHLWAPAENGLPPKYAIIRCGVMLGDLTPIGIRQLDLFDEDDNDRQKWERVQGVMDIHEELVRSNEGLQRFAYTAAHH